MTMENLLHSKKGLLCTTTALIFILFKHVAFSHQNFLRKNLTFFKRNVGKKKKRRRNSGEKSNAKNGNKTNNCEKEEFDDTFSIFWWLPTLVAFLFSLNTLDGDFVHDDIPAIVKNPDVHGRNELSSVWWRNVFTNDFWGLPMRDEMSHKSYRPITTLIFRLNFDVCSGNPRCFHATNIFLHTLATFLFTLLCSSSSSTSSLFKGTTTTSRRKQMTITSSLMFALHPIHTEAVAGCVGCADVLACVGTIISFLCLKRSFKSEVCSSSSSSSNGEVIPPEFFSLMAGIFAFFCKETGVMAFAINIAFLIVLSLKDSSCKNINNIKEKSKKLIIKNFSTLSVLLFVRFVILTKSSDAIPSFTIEDNSAALNSDQITRMLTLAFLPVHCFWLLLCPSSLSYDWQMGSVPLVTSFTTDWRVPLTILFYTFVSMLAKISITNSNKSKDIWTIRVAILFLILPFIPASNLIFPVGFVIAERILYIPSIGYVMLVSLGFLRIRHYFGLHCKFFGMKKKRKKNLANAFLAFLLLTFACKTLLRNEEWKSRESLFRSGVVSHPGNAKLHYNYGNWLREQGKFERAQAHYKEAIRIWPNYTVAHNNLAAVASSYTEAMRHLRNALFIDPGHSNSLYNFALLLRRQGQCAKAIPLLERCLKEDKSNERAKILLLECLFNAKEEEKMELEGHEKNKGLDKAQQNGTSFDKFEEKTFGAIVRGGGGARRSRNENGMEVIFYEGGETSDVGGKQNYGTIFLLVDSYINLGHLRKAEDLLDDFLANKRLEELRMLHSNTNVKKKKMLRSEMSQALYQLSHVYMEQGRLPEAIKTIVKARRKCICQKHKSSSCKEPCWKLISQHADILQSWGHYSKAVMRYREALHYKSDDFQILLSLGTAYHVLGRDEMANKFYMRSKMLNPNDDTLVNNMDILRKRNRGVLNGNGTSLS